MAKLEKVIITTGMPETAVSAEINKGTTGYIVEEHGTPAGHACIRFLAKKLGYEYDAQNDDPDYKYIRMFIPNANFQKVLPKNTVGKSQKTSKSIDNTDADKMRLPEIMVKRKDGWQVLPGHACYSQKEMEEYVQTLDPQGKYMKLMDLSGVELNSANIVVEEQRPKKKI